VWSRLRKLLGDRGEDVAVQFLRQQGFKIICRDAKTIVFVEVKTRRSDASGQPYDAVDPDKQKKLTRMALAYLKQKNWLERRARFDVVSILMPDDDQPPTIRHFPNAFEPPGFGQLFS
jgi:putative endonuclease